MSPIKQFFLLMYNAKVRLDKQEGSYLFHKFLSLKTLIRNLNFVPQHRHAKNDFSLPRLTTIYNHGFLISHFCQMNCPSPKL